jgi:hypothetical protein
MTTIAICLLILALCLVMGGGPTRSDDGKNP